MIQVVLISFGYRHGPAPQDVDVTVDVRQSLYDPHLDPGMRQLTGRDARVAHRVLTTPGASELLDELAGVVDVLARLGGQPRRGQQRLTTLAIGCAGGRHRSVALVEHLAALLDIDGWRVEVEHRDIGQPVLCPQLPGGAR